MDVTAKLIELVSAIIVLYTAVRGAKVVNRIRNASGSLAGDWGQVLVGIAGPFVLMLGFAAFLYAYIWINKQIGQLTSHRPDPVRVDVAADSLPTDGDSTAHRFKVMLRSAMGVNSPGDRDDLLARIATDANGRGAHRLAIEAASRIEGPSEHDRVLSDLTRMDLRARDFDAASTAAGQIQGPRDRDKAETSVVNAIDSTVRPAQ